MQAWNEQVSKNKTGNHLEITIKMRPCVRIYETFINCLKCFEGHTAHHQELKNYNCSLWFYIRLWLPADKHRRM